MKKEILKVDALSSLENLSVYAISSSESEIRICQILNREFNISLALEPDFKVIIKNHPLYFKRYLFEGTEETEKYYLLVNRNQGNILFRELKTIDFILIVLTESSKESINTALQRLKETHEISAVYNVDPKSLKLFSRLPL